MPEIYHIARQADWEGELASGTDVKYEASGDGGEPFPHIYGPLNGDAVLAVHRFEPSGDRVFSPLSSDR